MAGPTNPRINIGQKTGANGPTKSRSETSNSDWRTRNRIVSCSAKII